MSILKTKLFSILDINESVLHTEAHKGYVRTEPATITKCWMLPGHVKTAILRRNRRAFSIFMLRSCSTNKKRKLHGNLPVMGTEAFWEMVCRQQPTTPPTSVGTLLFPWWWWGGSLSCPFSLAGLVALTNRIQSKWHFVYSILGLELLRPCGFWCLSFWKFGLDY